MCINIFFGGELGIRTPGSFHFNGFQDRRFRPLSQLSKRWYIIYHKNFRIASIFYVRVGENKFSSLLFLWVSISSKISTEYIAFKIPFAPQLIKYRMSSFSLFPIRPRLLSVVPKLQQNLNSILIWSLIFGNFFNCIQAHFVCVNNFTFAHKFF